jgi:hypothetical protein
LSRHDSGSSSCATPLSRNIAPNRVLIAAGVERSSAPSARPSTPEADRITAEPITARATPASDQDAAPSPISACPPVKAIADAARPITKTTTAKTAILPHRTGRRCGTAVSDDRIIPVLYSLAMNSTPRVPNASWAKVMPARLASTGPSSPASEAGPDAAPESSIEEASRPMPISSATAVARVIVVERRDQNLIHSERITRPCVTFRLDCAAGATLGAAGDRVAVLMRLLLRSGTRRRPWSAP